MEQSNKLERKYNYIRFQSPVPPGPNLEPVYEFRLDTKDKRYLATQITRDQDTVYLMCGDCIQETPWVNVVFARPIL